MGEKSHINRTIRMMDPTTRKAIIVAVEIKIDEDELAHILGRKAYHNASQSTLVLKGAIKAEVRKVEMVADIKDVT